jgi:hypothetical protein
MSFYAAFEANRTDIPVCILQSACLYFSNIDQNLMALTLAVPIIFIV